MRRMLGLALAFCMAVLPVTPALAQSNLQMTGPGGVIYYSTASVSCVNTATECSMLAATIPQGLVATMSIAAASATTTAANVGTTPPLHFVGRGFLSTGSSPGTLNVGVNFGGATTATLSLVNGITPVASLVRQPVTVEIWVAPLATGISSNTMTLSARLSYQNGATAALASETTLNAHAIGTVTLNTTRTLNLVWRWTTAANDNALTLHQRTINIGN